MSSPRDAVPGDRSPVTGHRTPLRWALLVDPPAPGWHNMAVDCALLDFVERDGGTHAFLRLYQWAPHCLSFGRHEPAARRYDRERIRALGLDCVRRPTGGRAVWHARELTYAVAAPVAPFGSLPAAYRRIHEMLADALRDLGASPELATGSPTDGPLPSGPCFAGSVGGEVLVGGRKVIGSAQLRQGSAFLQHGSLLLQDDQQLVRDLAGLSAQPAAEAPLATILGRPVDFSEALGAVRRSAACVWGGNIEEPAVPQPVIAAVSRHAERFRADHWTWER